MKHLKVQYLIPIVFLLLACTKEPNRQLEGIESYIQTRPDSALVALNAIDTLSLKTKRQKALYSLLCAMAFDKNYIDTTDFSVIQPALDWYENHNDGDHWVASLFYAGVIKYNSRDYPNALAFFQQANGAANSVYWKAMSVSYTSFVYHQCYSNTEDLLCCLEAMKLWSEYGDSLKIKQSLASLAIAYHVNREDSKVDSIYSTLCFSKNPYYPAFSQWADCKIRRPSPDYSEILGLFETGFKNGSKMTTDMWYEYAYALHRCGKTGQSESILQQLSSVEESTASCLWLGKIARDQGDFEKALEYSQRWKILADKIVYVQLSQSLFKSRAEHYRLESEINAKEASIFKISVLFLIAIFVLLSLLFYNYYRSKRLKYEMEMARICGVTEKMMEMMDLAKNNCQEAKANNVKVTEELVNLRQLYANLYQDRFSEIGRMFDFYNNEQELSQKAAEQYIQQMEKIFDEIKRGESGQKEFEKRINMELDNIMGKLRLDFPEFKESDFRFLSYVIVGFDATTRSIILNETPNNMRVKKARLLKKIMNSDSENIPLYSCFLK